MKLFKLLIAAASLVLGTAVFAQSVEGEVRKIDKAQAKLTLVHGEIKSLQMPAMTMVWRVRDPAMLDKLAVGDKVRFQGEKVNGQFTVVQIDVAR